MPFTPVPDTIQMELRHLLDGQMVENTLYFRNNNGAWGDQEAATFAQTIGAWYAGGPLDQLSQDLTLREVYITDLSSVSGFTVTVPLVPPTPGGVAEESMSNNVAVCVSFRTAFRGRSFRGRNYLAGIPIGAVLHNTLTTGFVNAINDAYGDLQSIVNAVGVEWVVVSRYSGGVLRPTGIATPVQAAFLTDTTVDSQRRRLPGRGR